MAKRIKYKKIPRGLPGAGKRVPAEDYKFIVEQLRAEKFFAEYPEEMFEALEADSLARAYVRQSKKHQRQLEKALEYEPSSWQTSEDLRLILEATFKRLPFFDGVDTFTGYPIGDTLYAIQRNIRITRSAKVNTGYVWDMIDVVFEEPIGSDNYLTALSVLERTIEGHYPPGSPAMAIVWFRNNIGQVEPRALTHSTTVPLAFSQAANALRIIMLRAGYRGLAIMGVGIHVRLG